MRLQPNEIEAEFRELIDIGNSILEEGNDAGLSTLEFIQLCLDVRISEKDEVDLKGKNIVIPNKEILQ